MFYLPRKFFAPFVFISLALIYSKANAAAHAAQKPSFFLQSGTYFGFFGGVGHSGNNDVTQTGTVNFRRNEGGELNVNAAGHSGGNVGITGLQAGYAWPAVRLGETNPIWSLVPAAELEGYYLHSTQKVDLDNPTTRTVERHFSDTFPLHTGIFLVNGVFTFKNSYEKLINPYLGVGMGAADVSISDAVSAQTQLPEPGVNHFNSSTNDSSWTFAAQTKAGVRFDFNSHWRLFAEYRLLFLSASNYTFGETQYPTHTGTTRWKINLGNMSYNMGVAGIEYSV